MTPGQECPRCGDVARDDNPYMHQPATGYFMCPCMSLHDLVVPEYLLGPECDGRNIPVTETPCSNCGANGFSVDRITGSCAGITRCCGVKVRLVSHKEPGPTPAPIKGPVLELRKYEGGVEITPGAGVQHEVHFVNVLPGSEVGIWSTPERVDQYPHLLSEHELFRTIVGPHHEGDKATVIVPIPKVPTHIHVRAWKAGHDHFAVDNIYVEVGSPPEVVVSAYQRPLVDPEWEQEADAVPTESKNVTYPGSRDVVVDRRTPEELFKAFPSTFRERTTGTLVHFADKTPSIGLKFGSPLQDEGCPHCARANAVLTVREFRGFHDDGCRILMAEHTSFHFPNSYSGCKHSIEFEEMCERSIASYAHHEDLRGRPPKPEKIRDVVPDYVREVDRLNNEVSYLRRARDEVNRALADDARRLGEENERLRSAFVKRKFRLELVKRRVVEMGGQEVTAHEFEAADGAPVYLILTQCPGWIPGPNYMKDLERKLGAEEGRVIVRPAPVAGAEVVPFELVPVDPLPEDFVPREEVGRRIADALKAEAEECLKGLLKGVIPPSLPAPSFSKTFAVENDLFAEGPTERTPEFGKTDKCCICGEVKCGHLGNEER